MTNEKIIVAKNITKIYRLGELKVRALQNISLEIRRGEFIMVTGRNGSGKSTLLHQLGLLDLPDSGEIIINGQEVTQITENKRAVMRLDLLGYIFQEYALIPELTALENVLLPALTSSQKAAREKAISLLKKVDLGGRLNHLPRQLSGGEQQKVAIARALINDPMILLADEPTANLDSVISKEILEIFKKLNQDDGLTIVMISHEKEETFYGNRIITMQDGKII